MAEARLPDAAYVPANAAVAAALVALARRSAHSSDDLGLHPAHARRSLALGGVTAAAAAAFMAFGATWRVTRHLFDDARVPAQARRAERLYQLAIRIPLGTAAFEEVAFRGVLLALLRGRMSLRAAVAIDSAAFGLWHIVPTLAAARANRIAGARRTALVIASVATTSLAGAVFCALRLRGGHLLAPALLHLAVNDAGYALAWWVRQPGQAATG